jgi:hypothetical protein
MMRYADIPDTVASPIPRWMNYKTSRIVATARDSSPPYTYAMAFSVSAVNHFVQEGEGYV